MKRDPDLIRLLLIALEAAEQAHSVPTIDGYSGKQCHYHFQLLVDAGYVSKKSIGYRLTWSGHELLDSARPGDRWEQAKATCEKVGGYTIDALKDVLVSLLKSQIGLS